MNVSFERATADDVEALVQAQIAAFHYDAVLYPGVGEGGPPGYNSVERTLKTLEEREYFKIVVEGQIAGGFIAVPMEPGHCHLDLLFVTPEYQSRGVGTRAMQFIEQHYPATRWTLDTPDYATRNHHFYEKFGYEKVSVRHEPDITLIAYEKRV